MQPSKRQPGVLSLHMASTSRHSSRAGPSALSSLGCQLTFLPTPWGDHAGLAPLALPCLAS